MLFILLCLLYTLKKKKQLKVNRLDCYETDFSSGKEY